MIHRVFRLVVLASVTPTLLAQSDPASLEGTSWYAEVTRQIQLEEYQFRELAAEPGVWAASNRSQGFRARVSSLGLDVLPHDASDETWSLSLSTVSFGREGDVRELRAAVVSVERDRAQLDHGLLCEFLENRDDGLEQSWTIAQRPRGVTPLWIGLSFAGDLALRIDEGARSGVLVNACGEPQLRYRDLLVFDANGRELDARLAPSPIGVGIEIDDAGASYPLTVDPLLTGPAWTGESNQTLSYYGFNVAAAGDVNGDGFSDALVGACLYDTTQAGAGRVYLYTGSVSGLSTSAAWTAEGTQEAEILGIAVGTAGDVNGDGFSDVVVGASEHDTGVTNAGQALVYLGSSSGLAAAPAWTVAGDQADARFGVSAYTAGDVNGDGYSDVIIGASHYDNGQSNEGRAFVYLGSSSGLAASAAWTAECNQVGASFGSAVSTAGDVNGDGFSDVIVGAPLFAGFGGTSPEDGAAFVYLGSSSGLATSPAWSVQPGGTAGLFGWSVSTAGDVNADGFGDVIVGMPASHGRAIVYCGSSTGLSTTACWLANSPASNGSFGASVTSAGDVNGDGFSDVVVGAPGASNDIGNAYLYLGSSTGLGTSAAKSLNLLTQQLDAHFGSGVAGVGDVNGDGFSDVVAGANLNDNDQADEGRAFLYLGSAAYPSKSANWTVEGELSDARVGFAVATAGDVNGDGFSDVIVGAFGYDNGQAAEGRAFVYHGSASGLATGAAWTAEGNQILAVFGSAVSTAGDVNGDGYSDVIVGSYWYDNGETNEGRAFVYTGSPSGLSSSPSWTAESNQANAYFGIAVSTAGDVNGDGFSDVIVGALNYDNGETDEGRAFVYLGSAGGLAATPAWTAESNQATSQYAFSLSTAGDVNADGFSDVIVGASLYANGQFNEGRAFVYTGSSAGLSVNPAWTAESNQISAGFGWAVNTAGDVNGDGFSDVIVGSVTYGTDGRAFVYMGSGVGLSPTPAWTGDAWSFQPSARFGTAVASAGDVNGDGFSEVIVGANQYDAGETDEGAAFLFFGASSGLVPAAAEWTAASDQANAFFGASVSTAGDVNGDGYADVIVGAGDFDNGQTNEGRAYVFMGNDGRGGWTRALRQRRANDAAPIALLGRSSDKTRFRLNARFESALAGFDWATPIAPKVRLEWQVVPLGSPYSANAIDSSAEQSVTGSPLVFNELAEFEALGPFALPLGVAVHQAAGVYHWRARWRTNNPLLPVTPWVSIPGNTASEAKLRTGRIGAAGSLRQ